MKPLDHALGEPNVSAMTAESSDQPPKKGGAEESVFVQRLREAVRRTGRTTVIEKTGIIERSIARYLSGESEPPVRKLVAIAEVCGVSVDWLVGVTPDIQRREPKNGRVMLLDEEMEEVLTSDEPLEADLVRRFMEWAPRMLVGLAYLPEKTRVVTPEEGERLIQTFLTRVMGELPELTAEWYEVFGDAVKKSQAKEKRK